MLKRERRRINSAGKEGWDREMVAVEVEGSTERVNLGRNLGQDSRVRSVLIKRESITTSHSATQIPDLQNWIGWMNDQWPRMTSCKPLVAKSHITISHYCVIYDVF